MLYPNDTSYPYLITGSLDSSLQMMSALQDMSDIYKYIIITIVAVIMVSVVVGLLINKYVI